MKDHMFRDRVFLRDLMRLTLPMAAQQLMLAAVSVADTFMLGGVNQNSMSAVSLASKVQFVQNLVVSCVVSAFVILAAQYWGKRDRASISRLFGICLKMSGGISLLAFLGCELFPHTMMRLFTSQDELIQIGAQYLRIAGFSYLLTGLSQCYLALLKTSNHTTQTAVISCTTVAINILLNAVFIFGWFGLPQMGVYGAALATLIARAIELVWSVSLSFCKNHERPDYRMLFVRNTVLMKDYLRCMMPLLGAGLLWGIGFVSYSSFMGHIDIDAPAANSVASSVIELVCCMGNGIAHGGGILLGNQLGAGKLDTAKLYGDRMTRLSVLVGILTTLILVALTPLIMQLIQLNETATRYLRDMLVVMTVYTIGRVMNTIIINGIFASGGDTMFDLYSLAVTMWGIAIPLAVLGTFVFHWPVWTIYACTCLDEVGKIPWVLIHYRKYKWVKDLTREKQTEQ